MPAGEAVPVAVGDRMRDDRTQPADQRFEHRIEDQRARARDEQVDREPPAPPDGEDDRRRPDDRPQHAAATEPGDRLDHGHERGVARNQAVDPGRGAAVGGLQRRPLQAHQDEQEREHQRCGRDHSKRRQTAVPAVEGIGWHRPTLPAARRFTRAKVHTCLSFTERAAGCPSPAGGPADDRDPFHPDRPGQGK